ncbi:MAG: hypothetical protein BWK75_04190 [Candidatus Altiarchaeales archaeon A3]|nr:MAG: hypothetical protein BWK75_04190 [Candidatus Altiarchaeales archaeon A3]
MTSPFGSEKVIKEHISEADLKTYFVGFDLNDKDQKVYRWKNLIDVLQNVIPEFAFGHHEGTSTDNNKMVEKVKEAARSIYKIKEFKEAKEIYEKDGEIADDDEEKKYLKRGEFGELILHLLLRDFHNTIPLLSKIYFKDTYGSTVHGFDAVHIQLKTKTLWLGESKLYTDGKKGIAALIEDIKNHFKQNYLQKEFAIVSKKIKPYNYQEKNYWLDLMDKNTKLEDLLKSVTIPLVCTYTSDNFTKYDDEALPEFIDDYEKEVRGLKKYFDEHNNHPLKTHLNIILLLFPVKGKNELVKRMHKKLYNLQSGEDDECE